MFLPGNENQSSSLLGPLGDLQRLTEAGPAVLLLHHPAKGEPRLGQAARGTGALSACADILLELRVPKGDAATRRRRLFGFSRYHETPHRLSVELNPEGTEYLVFSDTSDDDVFNQALSLIFAMLAHAAAPLTRHDILARWPANLPRPEPAMLWRWLNRATVCGLLICKGTGKRGDPFRYNAAARRVG